jgi:hypothetical protein
MMSLQSEYPEGSDAANARPSDFSQGCELKKFAPSPFDKLDESGVSFFNIAEPCMTNIGLGEVRNGSAREESLI